MSDPYRFYAIFDGSIQVLVTEAGGSARSSPVFHSMELARQWVQRDRARWSAEAPVVTHAERAQPALVPMV